METDYENNANSANDGSFSPKKLKRARKKQLYKSIRDQMEFYFSPANLSKARYVATKLEEGNGCIPLSEFLTFNKIKLLTTDVLVLKKALARSQILTVTDDMTVKLTFPLAKKENEDDCVIYVERLPPEADHKWISDMFSRYGKIDYISLPRFSKSNKCKGFAFVEFGVPESALKAIEKYKESGQYLSECDEPGKILSNAIKEESAEGVDENACAKVKKSLKRKKVSGEEVKAKKVKLTDEPSAGESNQEKKGSGAEESEKEGVKKKKTRKKKKKRSKVTVEAAGLQILSKKDWKVLRNKYLSTQKKKMSLLKMKLSQTQRKNNEIETKPKTESTLPEQMIHGLIVQVRTEPINDLNEFKKQVNALSSRVNFIDVKEGSDTAMIRLASIDESKAFCEKSPWPEARIIEGDEEEQYWKVIRKDREEKRNQSKKERGKQKLLKKAEKVLGKHIFFDET